MGLRMANRFLVRLTRLSDLSGGMNIWTAKMFSSDEQNVHIQFILGRLEFKLLFYVFHSSILGRIERSEKFELT